jgi:hypothetical protein
MASARCDSCGAPVIRATTVNGREGTPIDAAPDAERGNLFLLWRPGNQPLALAVSSLNAKGREAVGREGVPLYLSHFATCPDAEKWRRRPERAERGPA